MAPQIPRSPPGRLDQGSIGPQIAFLVRIQNRHQRHLRKIQSFTQEIDPHQHVEDPAPKIANDLSPFQRLNVGMQIPHLDPEIVVILAQILRHALGQGGDQYPPALRHFSPHFSQEIVDLPLGRSHLDDRIHQTGRTNNLLNHFSCRVPQLIGARRRGHIHRLRETLFKLGKLERPVIDRRRQSKTVLDQGPLPRIIPLVHPADLGNRRMRFVHDQQKVFGEIVDKRRGLLAWRAATEMPRIVLDAMAIAHRPDHFQVELGALRDPLGFHELILFLEIDDALVQFLFDARNRPFVPIRRNEIVRVRIDRDFRQLPERLSRKRIDFMNGIDHVAEQFDPDGDRVIRSGKNLDDVTAGPEGTAVKIHVAAGILNLDQLGQNFLPPHLHPLFKENHHLVIDLWRPQAVDAGDRRDDQHVVPLKQRGRCRMPHLIDRIVYGGVLGNISVALRDIGFRLVVIVVTDEILHRIVGEELFKFLIELTGQRLVMDQHQGGLLHLRHHVGHGKGLTGSGDAQQRLMLSASRNPGHQLVDGLTLISAGLEGGFELKQRHGTTFQPLSYHRTSMAHSAHKPERCWPSTHHRPLAGPAAAECLSSVNAWSRRPGLPAYERNHGSHPRRIGGHLAPSFGGAAREDPDSRSPA